jgi:hypothetical protein
MLEGIRWTYDLLLKGDGFKDINVDEYPWDMPLDSVMKRAMLERSQTAFNRTQQAPLACPSTSIRVLLTPRSRSMASRISVWSMPLSVQSSLTAKSKTQSAPSLK